MARPSRCRKICLEPAYDNFRPDGIPASETVNMTLDEYEVMRLIDLENCTHAECARQMGISRTTVTEIYENVRYKLADSVVNGKPLYISGGNYTICDGNDSFCCNKKLCKASVPVKQISIKGKVDKQMRIAVTYENGEIKQTQIIDTNGQGHGALASFLVQAQADVLICGGIGGGAQAALASCGIRLFGGVSGNADDAVQAFISGQLNYNPDVQCSHHEHGHSCGGHQGGEDKHGCAGN